MERIAKVAHEANRAYCATIGDDSQLSWEESPQWQRESAIKGAQFHVTGLLDGNVHGASASHEAWLKEKVADGWKYGPVKDPAKKEHPCMVAYAELPKEQQQKDFLFAAIVRAFYDFQVLGEPHATA